MPAADALPIDRATRETRLPKSPPTPRQRRNCRHLGPATHQAGSETGLDKSPLSKPPECNDVPGLPENAFSQSSRTSNAPCPTSSRMLRHHRAVRDAPCATTRNPLKTTCFEKQGRRQRRRDTLLDRAVQNIALPEVFSPRWIDLQGNEAGRTTPCRASAPPVPAPESAADCSRSGRHGRRGTSAIRC